MTASIACVASSSGSKPGNIIPKKKTLPYFSELLNTLFSTIPSHFFFKKNMLHNRKTWVP